MLFEKESKMPIPPEALRCKILGLTSVDNARTKILATFDLSLGDGLLTIVGCRLVERIDGRGRTVYGPSVQRPATGTYPRFVRFEQAVLPHITALASAEYARVRSSEVTAANPLNEVPC